VVALLGVALDPRDKSQVSVDKGMKSLNQPLTKPSATPEYRNCSA